MTPIFRERGLLADRGRLATAIISSNQNVLLLLGKWQNNSVGILP